MDSIELGQAIGRIEATGEAVKVALEAHTKADTENFAALSAKLDALDLQAAVRRYAWKWAAGVAAFVATVAQVAQAFGWLP